MMLVVKRSRPKARATILASPRNSLGKAGVCVLTASSLAEGGLLPPLSAAGVLVRLGVAAFSQGNEPEMGTPSQGGGGVWGGWGRK